MKVYATDKSPCHQCSMNRLPKANELPLYVKSDHVMHEAHHVVPNILESRICVVRKEVSNYISVMDVYWKQATGLCNIGIAHSKSTYDYITEKENVIPRTMTIASGGLLGLLLAARGGLLRKLFYSSVGVSIMSVACYPKEAKTGVQVAFTAAVEKASDALKRYGGAGRDKGSAGSEHKNTTSSAIMNIEHVTKTIKSWGSKIYPMDKMGENKKIVGDPGQSSSKDSDLYSTRS